MGEVQLEPNVICMHYRMQNMFGGGKFTKHKEKYLGFQFTCGKLI